MTGASPSVGLVQQTAGARRSRRYDPLQHLLLAAGQLGPLSGQTFLEVSEQVEIAVRAEASRLHFAQKEILLPWTLRPEKIPRYLRASAMPIRAISFDMRAMISLP